VKAGRGLKKGSRLYLIAWERDHVDGFKTMKANLPFFFSFFLLSQKAMPEIVQICL
jgi:hypothetical protein